MDTHKKTRKKNTSDLAPLYVIDFPTELRRRAKSVASLRGVTLREFLIAAVTASLENSQNSPANSDS